MSITNISQNRISNEQPNSLNAKRNNLDKGVGKKDSESALVAQGDSQVTLNKMSQALGSQDKRNVAMDDMDDISSANFSSSNMMQAHSNKITPEFVASLLDRNPYTSG